PHHPNELEEDRRRDIGNYAQSEDRETVSGTHVRRAWNPARLAASGHDINAGKWNVGADPEDKERAKRERDAAPQLRVHLRRPRSFDFLIRPSYWWAKRYPWICATVSIVTLTTISSEVPPK